MGQGVAHGRFDPRAGTELHAHHSRPQQPVTLAPGHGGPTHMSKPRSLIADYAVYLVARLLVCVIQALSPAAARRFAAGLAWLAYRLDRRHREVARDNLRRAFPGRYDDAELEAVVRSVYRHFSTLLIEIIQ